MVFTAAVFTDVVFGVVFISVAFPIVEEAALLAPEILLISIALSMTRNAGFHHRYLESPLKNPPAMARCLTALQKDAAKFRRKDHPMEPGIMVLNISGKISRGFIPSRLRRGPFSVPGGSTHSIDESHIRTPMNPAVEPEMPQSIVAGPRNGGRRGRAMPPAPAPALSAESATLMAQTGGIGP